MGIYIHVWMLTASRSFSPSKDKLLRYWQAFESKKYSIHCQIPFKLCVRNFKQQTSDLFWKRWDRWLHRWVCVCMWVCCNPSAADRAHSVHFPFSSTLSEHKRGTQPGSHWSLLTAALFSNQILTSYASAVFKPISSIQHLLIPKN